MKPARAVTVGSMIMALGLTLGGCKKHVAAHVPGTIDTFDAYAGRALGDAQEAIMSTKAWELCSDAVTAGASVPSVTFDKTTRMCPVDQPSFPAAGRAILFKTELSYNVALAAAQTYHAGSGGGDTTVLTQALGQLSGAVADLLNGIGRGK